MSLKQPRCRTAVDGATWLSPHRDVFLHGLGKHGYAPSTIRYYRLPVNNNPLLVLLETDARPFALRHFHAVVLQCVEHVVPSEVHRGRCSAYSGQCPAVLGAHRQPTAVAAQREDARRCVRPCCRERCGPNRGAMRPQHEAAEDRWRRTTGVRDAPSMRHRVRSGRGSDMTASAYPVPEVILS